MNGRRQLDVPYVNGVFPYSVTQDFMDLFGGLAYTQVNFGHTGVSHGHAQGFVGLSSSQYHDNVYNYEMSGYVTRNYEGSRSWGNYPIESNDQPLALVMHGNGSSELTSISDVSQFGECVLDNRGQAPGQDAFFQSIVDNRQQTSTQDVFSPRNQIQHAESNAQVTAEVNVDPDNMTYEELLELGVSVGTQNRGLPPEMISLLPISKYKRGFFPRQKSRERCVICQMNYRRGDMRMTLPCKHIYHASCVSRWLRINKACPVCFVDVLGVERRR